MNEQSVRRRGAGAAAGFARPVRSGRVPPATDFFSPRPETGHGLESAAGPPGSGDYPSVTILTGPAGLGKTCLAAAVMAAQSRAGNADLQVWVNAASPSAVVTGFAAAAADVGIAHRAMPPDAACTAFLDWLRDAPVPWIVVLDNMTDPGGLARLWPLGGNGQLLITCREAADVPELAAAGPRVARIGEFSPREALGYLTARLYDDADKRAEAVDLAVDLGYLPLALGLAGSVIANSAMTCRQYRGRFSARWAELAGPTASRPVTAADVAWSLALDLADQRVPYGLARPVLAITALLDPAGVPLAVPVCRAARDFLSGRGPVLLDEKSVLAALGGLAQCGLITVDRAAEPVLVAVHSVISEIVRKMAPAPVLDDAARAAADALVEVWPQAGDDAGYGQALRGCTGWLGGLAGDLLWLPEPHPVLIAAGSSLVDGGLAGLAVSYLASLLDLSGRLLGPEHQHTLAIRDLLATAQESAGRLTDAVELIAVGVAEREAALGSDHPETISARAELAKALRSAGRYDEAIDACERVIADREWVLGTDHPDTIAARSQLASTCLAAGQPERAAEIYERNVADWERALPPEDRTVLTEYLNLGSAYQAAGRIDDAIAVFSRVRTVDQRTLGPEHPQGAVATSYLAYAYRKAGRLKEAITLYRQALSSREAGLGPDHPDTLTSLANLASGYHSAHRMKEAIPLYERLLAARERVCGAEHRDTLTARGNLAGAYHSAGRLADALPVYEETLADFVRVLGPDHPDTLTSRANLANAYYMARRHSDAIAMYRRTISDCERALGPDHPLTRTISDNLSAITRLSMPFEGSFRAVPTALPRRQR